MTFQLTFTIILNAYNCKVFKVIKIYSKWPLLDCIHAANHCAICCCYSLFLTPTMASSMASPNWCLAYGLPSDILSTLYNPAERNLMHLCHETNEPRHQSTSSFITFVKKKGNTDRSQHGAKLSITVSVLYQSSWKFCLYLYLGLAALLAEHLLHAVTVHLLHSLMGRNQSPSKFCVH